MSTPKGVAIVTGAAQGIGKAVVLRLADDGFDVALNDIGSQVEKLEAIVDEVKSKGQRCSVHFADVSQEDQVERMVKEVVQEYGSFDVMVANAGIGTYSTITEMRVEEWDRILNVNARGTFLCYKYAGLQMIKQGRGGRIIGASSAAGKQGGASLGAYCASKFAIRGLTQSAAHEFGSHGITVNAYAPGLIDTPSISQNVPDAKTFMEHMKNAAPLKRIGTPEDIASLISFLVSKESQFITGQTLSINGGIFFD